MIDIHLMNLKIKNNEAEVLKTNERMSNGLYIKTVKFDGIVYKICPECKFYHILDRFTWNKSSNNYHPDCKSCRAKKVSQKYNENINDHIRQRMYAINFKVKNTKNKCNLIEFTDFFKTAKCQYTGKSLMDEFLNPNTNPNLQLEIDHIVPVSKGGTSKINNLQVLPKVVNTLKRDCSPSEYRETLNFLSKFIGLK